MNTPETSLSSKKRGLRLQAAYRVNTAALARFGAVRIPSPLGTEGTLNVLALPSGLRIDAGPRRILWRGPGLSVHLLNLETTASRELPGLSFPTGLSIEPNGRWDGAGMDEVDLEGTLHIANVAVLVQIHAQRVEGIDSYANSLAASLFVPGMGRLAPGFVPVSVEFSALGLGLGEVDISFEAVDDSVKLLQVPAEFTLERLESWTPGDRSWGQPATVGHPVLNIPSLEKRAPAPDPDPDGVEVVRQAFLNDVVGAVTKLAPVVFPAPIATEGFRTLVFPWFRPLLDWIRSIERDGGAAPADRQSATWIDQQLPIALGFWAGMRMRDRWTADHTSEDWFAAMILESQFGPWPWAIPQNLEALRRVVAGNSPNDNWNILNWAALANRLAGALNPASPPAVLEAWFAATVGAFRLDFFPALAERARSWNPPFSAALGGLPQDDSLSARRLLEMVDVDFSGFHAEITVGGSPLTARFTPGGLNVGLHLSEAVMHWAFSIRPSFTFVNVIVGIFTGGASTVMESNIGSVNVGGRDLQFDLLLTPTRAGNRLRWSLTSLGSGPVTAVVNNLGGALDPLLSQTLSLCASSLLKDVVLEELRTGLGRQLSSALEALGFPQTLRLFRGSLNIDGNRNVRLREIFAETVAWDVSAAGLRRFLALSDASIPISQLPGPADPGAHIFYQFSKAFLDDWIAAMWWFQGTSQPLAIDWKSLGITLPPPAADPPPQPIPPPVEEDDGVTITNRTIGDASPKFVNTISILTPQTSLRAVTGPRTDEPLGTARVPLSVKAGWVHFKLALQGETRHTEKKRVATGEIDSRGKPIFEERQVLYINRTWKFVESFTEPYLTVIGHLVTDIFLGLDKQEPLNWPVLRLAFAQHGDAAFTVDAIQANPPFNAIPQTGMDRLKSSVVESLKPRVQSMGPNDEFYSPDLWVHPALNPFPDVIATGWTTRIPGNVERSMIACDGNNMSVGLRLVSQLLGLPFRIAAFAAATLAKSA